MTPLHQNKTQELLTRIDKATNSELISITMNTPQNFTLELSVQDKNRGYDWINIAFEIDSIVDAKLIDDEKLAFVDMEEGISILFDEEQCGIGVGNYKSIDALKSAPLYFIGKSLKYEERSYQQ